jgi:hypothetical protein
MTGHTAELEVPVKLTPFFSLSPFYRYSTQQAVKYFAPYQEHRLTDEFYTSDYDLSTLDSHLTGLGLRYSPPGGILSMKHLSALELRYGHYERSTKLNSDIVTMLIKFK